ncbi:hypothetical protein PC113_g5474 [Phytophthora cactorum]|uniref:Uncharacterized protein n=1 Tax=Phytophthora cactorum TaxID=29920 RepID=A0A8T1CM08_9STRA|nr:hypothetical protein PC113_g5474 [Phytophthora cactorum]KAG2924088.1 hypothetical protein PC115_g8730 [Phytophthora cactorum]
MHSSVLQEPSLKRAATKPPALPNIVVDPNLLHYPPTRTRRRRCGSENMRVVIIPGQPSPDDCAGLAVSLGVDGAIFNAIS